MLPRSRSLFHFTKNMVVLESILTNGFWPRYCLEDVQWQNHAAHEFIAFPMVCFCDIPISRILEHVGFYGSYGIGLTKEWGTKNNLNPVFYFSGDNPVHRAIKQLTGVVLGLDDEETKTRSLRNIRHILAHSKPTTGRMIVSGEPVIKDFYQESEWRFVPDHHKISDYLRFDDYKDEAHLNECNEETLSSCKLKLLPSDVRYIFVPKDSDIPSIMNFIQSKLDHYPNADLKLLMSRVTSLESIAVDV